MASWESDSHQPEKIRLNFLERRKVKRVVATREKQRAHAIDSELAETIGKVAILPEGEARATNLSE